MRILVLNWRDITHPWAGGAELNIHEQAKRWVKAGHHVTLFCGAYKGSKRRETLDGIEIVRRGGRFTVYFWATIYYVFHCRKQYDIIVDLENGIPFFTPLYVEKPKVCIMHHVHTEQFRQEFSPPLAQIGIVLESYLMRLVYKNVPFITISESSREEMMGIGIAPAQCSVVHCGLDHESYHPGSAKTPYPSLLYLGRLMSYKRVDCLIRLMPEIIKECPSAILNIVGSGPVEAELRKLTSRLGLQDNVVFCGYVSEAIKIRLLQEAWLLAVPSSREGWGLVVIEANACGTPAIAFDVPGLREAIRDGQTGLIVHDECEFVKQVAYVLRSPDFRTMLARSALEHAADFCWDNTALQTLQILSAVVSHGHPRQCVVDSTERAPLKS